MNTQAIRTCPAFKVQNGKLTGVDELISEEIPLTLYLNGQEIVTMLCSPQDEKHLALGFLVSEGMIDGIDAIKNLMTDSDRGLIWVEADNVPPNPEKRYIKRCLTACCGRGRAEFYFANDARTAKYAVSTASVNADDINLYAAALQKAATTHDATHGVHCGAVAADGGLLFYAEDIGRHNVLDKLYGKCLENGLDIKDKILVFSGRVSSEVLLKASKMGVPVIIARSVPTSLAVDLAAELGITLVGAAKGDWFLIYTHPERIKLT